MTYFTVVLLVALLGRVYLDDEWTRPEIDSGQS
jgi:hypothetical protein